MLKTFLKCIRPRFTEWCYLRDYKTHPATIVYLDSGITKIDASLGEILVTVKKLEWTVQHGGCRLLEDEHRWSIR